MLHGFIGKNYSCHSTADSSGVSYPSGRPRSLGSALSPVAHLDLVSSMGNKRPKLLFLGFLPFRVVSRNSCDGLYSNVEKSHRDLSAARIPDPVFW